MRACRSLCRCKQGFELFTIEPTIKDDPEAITLEKIEEGICFKDVSFSYDGSKEFILKGINLTIHKGEVLAIRVKAVQENRLAKPDTAC